VDLATGEGLPRALEGCDVVVDASNDASRSAARTLVEGSRRLLAAEAAAGVAHHVGVSIVGCERFPSGYFRVKAEQERVVEDGAVPWTIVRATQFHELVATGLASVAAWGLVPLPRALLQTVASEEAARAVADVAQGVPRRRRVAVVGPEVLDLREIAETWRKISRRRPLLVPIPLFGETGRALRGGALTSERADVRGAVPFAAWLSARENGAR
jgi:uncharacterized protein YbjT (DUF2867 family)